MAVLDLPRPDSLPAKPERRVSRHGLDEGDLALIDWMLSKSPLERLQLIGDGAAFLGTLRRARRIGPATEA